MSLLASSFVSLNKFPLGRCAFALREVQRRAQARNAAAIAALAGRGVAEAEKALSMLRQLQGVSGAQFGPDAGELDNLVDYGVTGINSYCEAQIRLFHGEERAAAAERVRRALLPGGVGAITSLPFTEQHERVDDLIRQARSDALAADVALLLELTILVNRLADLNERYGEALRATSGAAPTREALRVQHSLCQEILCATVGLVFGHYATQPAELQAERDHLLEPILRQHEAIRASRRRRRAGRDVDPDTGAELPDAGDPGDAADAADPD